MVSIIYGMIALGGHREPASNRVEGTGDGKRLCVRCFLLLAREVNDAEVAP